MQPRIRTKTYKKKRSVLRPYLDAYRTGTRHILHARIYRHALSIWSGPRPWGGLKQRFNNELGICFNVFFYSRYFAFKYLVSTREMPFHTLNVLLLLLSRASSTYEASFKVPVIFNHGLSFVPQFAVL